MKEFYGNYLGLCINNNDPQKRGRVQVFIPHIMPALYENWNEAGEDIKMLCVGDNIPDSLPSAVVEKLMEILPWSESASPILGGSSPGNLISQIGGAISGAVNAVSNYFTQNPSPTPAGEGGNTATNADEQTLFNNAAKYGPVGSSKFSRSSSIDGNCGRGSRQIIGALTNNSYFNRGIGGTGSYGGISSAYAGSLSTGNPYLQNSGYYLPAQGIPANYTPQIGDTITGTSSGAGHVQVYIGNGKWVSDFTQRSYLTNYGNLTLHRMNNVGLAAVQKASPGLFSGTASSSQESGTSLERQSSSGQVAAPTPHQDQVAVETDDSKNNYGSIAKPEVTKAYRSLNSVPIANSGLKGIRGNNPGNLHTIGTPYIGQVGTGSDLGGNVAFFDTLGNGIAQNLKQISLNINRGQTTISSMAGGWTGTSGGTAAAVAQTWSTYSGIDVNEPLNFNNKTQMQALLQGISFNESSGVASNFQDGFNEGWETFRARNSGIVGAETTSSTSAETRTSSSSLVQNTDKHGSMAVVNMNNMAKGVFTYPSAGALLWVFFREGNPLFPVYFAANYGEREWSSAYRLGSDAPGYKPAPDPDNSATSTGTRINLGTGGLFSTDTTVPDDPTKDEKSLTLFGYDGSNMHFNEGYHQIFSKFDRRDSVEGDRWETTLGFKEEWVQGDSNEVCMGDVYVKIGNVSPPAVDAVTRIQQIIKECMEPVTQSTDCPESSTSTQGKSEYTKNAVANSTVRSAPITQTPTNVSTQSRTNNITTAINSNGAISTLNADGSLNPTGTGTAGTISFTEYFTQRPDATPSRETGSGRFNARN